MYRRLLIAFFLAAAAFFAAHVVSLMAAHTLTRNVAPSHVSADTASRVAPALNRLRLTEEILASGVFGEPGTVVEKASFRTKGGGASGDAPALVSVGPPIDAAKKIKLVGTVVGDGKISIAVVEDIGTKKQTLYHLHDVIVNVGQIAQIRQDAIVIRQGTQHESLDLAYAVSILAPNVQATPPPPFSGAQ